ncbi:GNAT family N-acetyltransferase [Azohydromonas caseinilytica]|uniref:GNAT family N-acetyltransferase n=1 Tax=Azohydromonas caseinilytica TaxID=2728836 RepID=A0A848FEH7_9BURK|nr:N-acetyltransferase [Azohydromonas caseinilytica]NML17225.1 GNAT family N-acetyltransferase [Azohydromonas caseinilytica]
MFIVPAIRLALPDDAAGIARMSREFIEDGLDWSWRRERVLRAMADPAVNVVVAHDGRTLTGFGIMEYGDLHAHLALLAVAPPYRQRRVGSRLVAWLEQPARIAGLEKVRLEARADNPGALLFYRRLGFEATGRAAGYYGGEIDAVRFEKSLRLG